MSSLSSLNTQLNLIEMAEEKSNVENLAISDVKEEALLEQEQAETVESSSRKHKRKASPSTEDDIPIKVVRTEEDPHTNTANKTSQKDKSARQTKDETSKMNKSMRQTKDETSEIDKSTRQTTSSESSGPDSVTALKRSASDLDTSFETPCKKLKTEVGSLRPEEGKKKHVRRRMKHLQQAIIDQMEFYFGDSNLSKDRFLRKVIDSSPDGYVDLAVFGNFNKLQSLHKDGVSLKVLAAAISKSKMLELSDDGTKVRRITPIKEIDQEETDSKTVYVEHLPAHASHMWIRSIFSQCGKVVYVSLPVYKTTRMIKGFAFVEFESTEEAAKACQLLNNPLPVKSEDKPGKFPKGNKTLNRLQKLAPARTDQDSNEENISDDQKTDASQNKTAATSKKKKHTKKKKTSDSMLDESHLKLTVTEIEPPEDKKKEQTEGKKKKKKKKKKQNQLVDGVASKEKEKCSSVEPGAPESADVESRAPESADVEPRAPESADVEPRAPEFADVEPRAPESADVAGGESITDVDMPDVQDEAVKEPSTKLHEAGDSGEVDKSAAVKLAEEAGSKKKKKKKRKGDKKQLDKNTGKLEDHGLQTRKMDTSTKSDKGDNVNNVGESTDNTDMKLSRKERKRLRQEDIRRKKLDREQATTHEATATPKNPEVDVDASRDAPASRVEAAAEERDSVCPSSVKDSHADDKCKRRNDGSELTSILKSKKGQERKKVEFDPVTVTNEFIKGREVRKRKKPKKEKLHLRVIAKKEWLNLKAEYIAQQKSHMAALKESLRELKMQENQGQPPDNRRVDLEDVFGTKRLKPSQDLKMAHVEALKFTPNVIVQWKCSHEMPRDKIRTMFKELSGDSIAYIDASEEAKFGYIRFKDEASAEEFAKLSRRSASFMARILPADQQEEYWKKANEDRVKKLGRKKHEKGADKIARKVFERNQTTFFQKPSHIVFNDEDDHAKDNKEEDKDMSNSKSTEESSLREGSPTSTPMDS